MVILLLYELATKQKLDQPISLLISHIHVMLLLDLVETFTHNTLFFRSIETFGEPLLQSEI